MFNLELFKLGDIAKINYSMAFRLQNTAWQDEALRQITSPPPLSECNRSKNRFPELISGLFAYSNYIEFYFINYKLCKFQIFINYMISQEIKLIFCVVNDKFLI